MKRKKKAERGKEKEPLLSCWGHGAAIIVHQADVGSDTFDSYILNQLHEALDHVRAVVAISIKLLPIVHGEVTAALLLKRLSQHCGLIIYH